MTAEFTALSWSEAIGVIAALRRELEIAYEHLHAAEAERDALVARFTNIAPCNVGDTSELIAARAYDKYQEVMTERDAFHQLLREAIDGEHIYGNDSEQWIIRAEAALAQEKWK